MNNSDLHDISINLLVGFLVFLIDHTVILLKSSFLNHEFKRMFGSDSLTAFHLVYGRLTLKVLRNDQHEIERWPYIKPSIDAQFSSTLIVSFAETKSIKYLTTIFSRRTKKHPILISDDELRESLDISYCSFGGYNNLKTIDVLESEKNVFYTIDLGQEPCIVSMRTQKQFKIEPHYHYGLIIKTTSTNFPNRTQICVAGLSESGTSGAAWYLSHRWRTILKKVGTNEFGCVVKVKDGQDESAEVVELKF
jgi:hypothetical protein